MPGTQAPLRLPFRECLEATSTERTSILGREGHLPSSPVSASVWQSSDHEKSLRHSGCAHSPKESGQTAADFHILAHSSRLLSARGSRKLTASPETTAGILVEDPVQTLTLAVRRPRPRV